MLTIPSQSRRGSQILLSRISIKKKVEGRKFYRSLSSPTMPRHYVRSSDCSPPFLRQESKHISQPFLSLVVPSKCPPFYFHPSNVNVFRAVPNSMPATFLASPLFSGAAAVTEGTRVYGNLAPRAEARIHEPHFPRSRYARPTLSRGNTLARNYVHSTALPRNAAAGFKGPLWCDSERFPANEKRDYQANASESIWRDSLLARTPTHC